MIYKPRKKERRKEGNKKEGRKEGRKERTWQLMSVGITWMKVHYYQNRNFAVLYVLRLAKQGHNNDLYHPLQNKTQLFYPKFFFCSYTFIEQ